MDRVFKFVTTNSKRFSISAAVFGGQNHFDEKIEAKLAQAYNIGFGVILAGRWNFDFWFFVGLLFQQTFFNLALVGNFYFFIFNQHRLWADVFQIPKQRQARAVSGKFMTDIQTISWIFLATALATNTKPTDINGISLVADGINHAVPTHKELQTSIAWLTKKGFIIQKGKYYELTDRGKLEYETASKHQHKLFEIWQALEKPFCGYGDN